MRNFEKKMVWRLICLTGSEKLGFTDDRRTDDGRPRDDSSCAVQ